MANSVNWTPEIIARMGKVPDQEIAARYGVSKHYIVNRAGKRNWVRPGSADAVEAMPLGPQ